MSEYFDGKNVCNSVNCDEAVAYGATIQSAILKCDESEVVQDLLLIDVTPLTLGIETVGGVMQPLITRNTKIPANTSKQFTTIVDNQTSVCVKVYEGERSMTADNNLLGQFVLSGIPPKPKEVPKIDVTFDIDADGILNVNARDTSTGKNESIFIENNKGRLSSDEIERMILQAEQYKAEDEEKRKLITSKNNLESYVYEVKNTIKKNNPKLKDDKDINAVLDKCKEILEWINLSECIDNKDIEQLKNDLKNIYQSINSKLPDTRSDNSERNSDGNNLVDCSKSNSCTNDVD